MNKAIPTSVRKINAKIELDFYLRNNSYFPSNKTLKNL